jgi:hypothetical protein
VGAEAGEDGPTRSFLVDVAAAQVEELPLREARRGAAVVPAPNGTLAVLGCSPSAVLRLRVHPPPERKILQVGRPAGA